MMRVNNKWKIIIFAIAAVFAFFYFGLGFRVNYQPDIYLRVNATSDYLKTIIVNQDGRILSTVIYYILRRGSFTSFYYLSLVISVSLMICAIARFGVILVKKYVEHHSSRAVIYVAVWMSLLSCITVANLFSVEFFLYTDIMVSFALAIFLSTDAACRYILRYLEEEKKFFFPIILIELFVVAFLYETISSIFVILILPFLLMKTESFMAFIKKQLIVGVYYVTPLIIKTLFTKIAINSDRAQFNQPSFAETAKNITQSETVAAGVDFVMGRITFGMWGFLILCIAAGVMIAYYSLRKNKPSILLKAVYIIGVSLILGLLPFLLRLSNNYAPRIYYPLGVLFGILCIYIVFIYSDDVGETDRPRHDQRILAVLLAAMMGIEWLSFADVYVDCYITNYEDRYISEMIGQRIDDYEQKNGAVIDKVVFYSDKNPTKYSQKGWCLTRRAFSSWGAREALNFYLDRDYLQGQIDQSIDSYYRQHDWSTFDFDQITFTEDTAHICMY